MANLTVFSGEVAFDVSSVLCFDMILSRTMADLAAGVSEVGRFLRALESSGLAVACRMAGVTTFDFLFREFFFQPFDAPEGRAFSGVCHEIEIFILVAVSTGFRPDIPYGLLVGCMTGR